MKILIGRITLGLAVLLMASAPVGFSSDDGLEVVCANAQRGVQAPMEVGLLRRGGL